MFFDCKVLDPEGNLKKIIKAEDMEADSLKICLSLLSEDDRKTLKNFDLMPLDEYELKIGYSV